MKESRKDILLGITFGFLIAFVLFCFVIIMIFPKADDVWVKSNITLPSDCQPINIINNEGRNILLCSNSEFYVLNGRL